VIFSPRNADLVLDGRKTMTRRPIKPGEQACRYRPGRTYSVQKGRGKPGCGYVQINAVRSEHVGEITLQDARAEGFRDRGEFFDYWAGMYADRAACPTTLLVWVVTFELVRVLPAPRPLFLARARGTTTVRNRSIDTEVTAEDDIWASNELVVTELSITVERHQPRLGADRHGGSAPVSRVRPLEPSAMAELEEDLQRELLRYRGDDPEDVFALCPRQGSVGDIRARRQRMGLRRIDGLQPLAPEYADRLRAEMLARGCSVRDLARAMDWSPGKAHGVIRQYRQDLPGLYGKPEPVAA
jgi:hypothetical protein